MSTPRLHSLAEFLAVARHRSFTAAAAELGITPSALSQAVRLLEQRVGVTLLTRTTRSVALTEAGRRLYDRAAPGVEQIVEALRGLNGRSGEITGTVRLNVPEAAVLPVLAPVLPVFRARHPGVTVEVHVDNRLVDIVAQGFDAGIRLEEFLERDMVHVRLTEAPASSLPSGARRGVTSTVIAAPPSACIPSTSGSSVAARLSTLEK